MTRQEQLQTNVYEQRLSHQLSLQSDQIERVFSRHAAPAQVVGGVVEQNAVRFDLYSQVEQGKTLLKGLTQDLLQALGVAEARLSGENGFLHLLLPREDKAMVPLLELLPLLSELPPATAVLGIDEADEPLLVTFGATGVSHFWVGGASQAGKSSLLRTTAVSLALQHRQSQLQLMVLAPADAADAAPEALRPLIHLPHMIDFVAETKDECADMLAFLVQEAKYRRQQQLKTPRIVVLIDDVDRLLQDEGADMAEDLRFLLQKGADVDMHLVLASSEATLPGLSDLLHAAVPLRIVGQVLDAEEAEQMTSLMDSQAEYLLGAGDFLAIHGETLSAFQAAYVDDYDLHAVLETLQRSRPQPLLARPYIPESPASAAFQEKRQTTAAAPTYFSIEPTSLTVKFPPKAAAKPLAKVVETPASIPYQWVPNPAMTMFSPKLNGLQKPRSERVAPPVSKLPPKPVIVEPEPEPETPPSAPPTAVSFQPSVQRKKKLPNMPQPDDIPFDIGTPPDELNEENR